MSDLSTRVRLRREQLGLSQEELARRMGYRSRSSITKLEKGINDLPSPKWRSWHRRWRPLPPLCWGWTRLRLSPGLEPLPTMVQVPLIAPSPAARPSPPSRTSSAISECPPRGTRISP